jgi:hypothetical protein
MPRSQTLSRRRFLLSGSTQFRGQFTESPGLFPTGVSSEGDQQVRRILPIHPDYWSLTISGTGETPLILSYKDTLALPSVDVQAPLICKGRPIPRTNTVEWRGILLQTLLQRLTIRQPFARFVAIDGYVTAHRLEYLAGAVLVYGMNDRPLTHEHGFPMRLMVPGSYGYKMPKWLARIELTNSEPVGFWESRGWSNDGTIQTTAEIIDPFNRESVKGSLSIRGVAYSGRGSICQIEVNIDDGPWMPVDFNPVSRNCVTDWSIQWTPSIVGDYVIKARAFDGSQWSESSAKQGTLVHVVNCY